MVLFQAELSFSFVTVLKSKQDIFFGTRTITANLQMFVMQEAAWFRQLPLTSPHYMHGVFMI